MITAPQAIGGEWALVAITFTFVLLRLKVRRERRGKFGWSDPLVIIGWLCFVAQAGMDTGLLKLGWFDGKIDYTATEYGPAVGLATKEDTIKAMKINFAETMKKLRIATHVVLAITVASFLSTTGVNIFLCMPVSREWAVGSPQFCSSNNSPFANSFNWGMHMFSDLLIFIIPFFVLKNLQLPTIQKFGIAFTFSLGFVCIMFANIVQLSYIYGVAQPLCYFFTACEQAWALLVVSLPAFKALLPSLKDFILTGSLMRSSRTGSRGSEKSGASDNSSGSRGGAGRASMHKGDISVATEIRIAEEGGSEVGTPVGGRRASEAVYDGYEYYRSMSVSEAARQKEYIKTASAQ